MGSSYFGGAGFPTWSLCVRAGACWSAKGGRVRPSQPTRGAKLSYTKSLSSTSTPSFLSSTPHFLAHRPTLFSLGAARLPCSRHKQIPKVSSTNPSLSDSDRLGWYLIPLVFWRRSKLEQGYQRGAKNRAVAHRQTSTARGKRGPNERCAQKPFLKEGNAFRPLNDDAAYDVVWADTALRRVRRGTSSVHQ